MTQRQTIIVVALVLALLAIIAPFTNSFIVLLATRVLVFSILAMSLDLLLGYTGLASMGQAAYFGIGTYLAGILASKYGFGLDATFWVVVPLGILSGAMCLALLLVTYIPALSLWLPGLMK